MSAAERERLKREYLASIGALDETREFLSADGRVRQFAGNLEDSGREFLKQVALFTSGTGNAFSCNLVMGVCREDRPELAYKAGQALGDAGSMVVGAGGVAGGATMAVAGGGCAFVVTSASLAAAPATIGGSLLGLTLNGGCIATAVGGAGLASYGATVGLQGAKNFGEGAANLLKSEGGGGGSGGPTKPTFKSSPSSSYNTNDVKLSNIVKALYKGEGSPRQIGSGSTADAIRNELATGLPTEGVFHSEREADS